MKSSRNKTIDLPLAEGQAYLERCLRVSEAQTLDVVQDRVILGDTFAVLPLLPKESVDLLIVDPPYNLAKDFHGSAFSAMPQSAL